ncbi:hypothetical protein V8F06_000789 [Rhypophila decipiens]
MDSAEVAGPVEDEAVSPRQMAPPIEQAVESLRSPLNPLDMRADPDAQATVTDFLDFTEYLPSDIMRSLTLIGNLDQNYVDASVSLDELTSQWGQLPTMSPESRPKPVDLCAQISEKMNRGVSSRVYAHAEAVRMSENINRHHTRIKIILSKLETMLENYTEAEAKSPVATAKSPQATTSQKTSARVEGQRVRGVRGPTVPGEVLAPSDLYDFAYITDESSSDDDDIEDDGKPTRKNRATSDGPTRIKVVKPTKPLKPGKVPKSRTSVPAPSVPGSHLLSTSAALAQLKPPPENAVAGSAEAPWGQLTGWELNRLRKRMKKNSNWTPSDTMIARELFTLKRGIDAFKLAKQKAEEEGKPFEGKMPVPVVDPVSGEERMPLGALSMETLASDEKNLSNRGMKLNEAKKLKREMLAKMAAEEAEESAKNFKLLAETLMNGSRGSQASAPDQANKATPGKGKPPPKKRKRDSAPEADAEKPELADGQASKLPYKRTKTETPVPHPQISANTSQVIHETPAQPPPRQIVHSTTPIPLPIHAQEQSITAKSGTSVASATSPAPSSNAGQTTITTANPSLAPIKLPGPETPIPLPILSPKKMTPIYPPVRETRKTQSARVQEQQQDTNVALTVPKPTSRAASPAEPTPKMDSDSHSTVSGPTATTTGGAPSTTAPENAPQTTTVTRRPASRGKASSQEPQPTLASERQRRASTARNTPAPDSARPPSRRSTKRPPPGAISRTVSGGKSAVGKRKAAPKKKRGSTAGGNKSNKDGKVSTEAADEGDVEVDDEGNVIDPDEARYCLCHNVSYGTMIQCDNVDNNNNIDNCKYEWFHLACVDLTEVPARTTKWYCPECRVLLKIGEKGEVNARGVKA